MLNVGKMALKEARISPAIATTYPLTPIRQKQLRVRPHDVYKRHLDAAVVDELTYLISKKMDRLALWNLLPICPSPETFGKEVTY